MRSWPRSAAGSRRALCSTLPAATVDSLPPFAATAAAHRHRHRPGELVDPRRLVVDGLGGSAVRRRRRQPAVPQPAGRVDVAGRSVAVRVAARTRTPLPSSSPSRSASPGPAVVWDWCCRCRCCRRATSPRSGATCRSVPHCGGCGGRRRTMFDANVRAWAGVWEVGGDQGDVRRVIRPAVRVPTLDRHARHSGPD